MMTQRRHHQQHGALLVAIVAAAWLGARGRALFAERVRTRSLARLAVAASSHRRRQTQKCVSLIVVVSLLWMIIMLSIQQAKNQRDKSHCYQMTYRSLLLIAATYFFSLCFIARYYY